MSKHTEGPWTMDSEMRTSVNAGDKHIAMVNFYKTGKSDDVSGDEHEANARLIAAAPELLAALEAVVECQKHTYGRGIDLHIEMIDIAKKARAAIALATGSQS